MIRIRARLLRWPVIGLVALVVIGAGTAYGVAGSSSTPRYRTVAATRADVQQTLSTSGTVDAADRADLAFATSGTIAALKVALGDEVRTGQVIATLKTGDLDASLTQAEASLAKAVAQLASDRAAQSTAVSNASSSSGSSGKGSSGSGSSGSGASTAALLAALKGFQDKVIGAQTAASAAIAAAKAALAAQNTACADAFTSTPTSSPTSTPTGSPTDTPTTTPDPADAACTAALAAVQAAQDAVSKAQDDLAQALNALSGALAKALGGSAGGGTGGTGSKPTSSARTTAATSTRPSSTGSSSPSASGASGATITAARLASDQAQIYQAQADLITAQQNRAQAVLRSTRPGRVVALDFAAGDAVTSGKTVATVVGGTAVTIAGTVAETSIDSVKLGQTVQVSVPGVTRTTTGTVSAIGLVADTSSGTTSYPVTVTVEDPTISLPTGSSALMQIVLATSRDVVTVPTSAVVRNGSTGTVQTWDGKTLATKRVTLGAVGARRVVIASGLTAGTEVVLAAMDQPIKGASSTLNNRGNFPTFSFRRAGGTGGTGGFGGPASFSKGGG